MQGGDYITSVTPVTQNGVEVGYTITGNTSAAKACWSFTVESISAVLRSEVTAIKFDGVSCGKPANENREDN